MRIEHQLDSYDRCCRSAAAQIGSEREQIERRGTSLKALVAKFELDGPEPTCFGTQHQSVGRCVVVDEVPLSSEVFRERRRLERLTRLVLDQYDIANVNYYI